MRTFKSITSALYVPGNQERMLLKCTQVGASLIVPDLEDAVPILEKPKALQMIKQHLPKLRQAAGNKVCITIRTNSIESGMFHDDVRNILDKDTAMLIDGFCATKVDTVEIALETCRFLSEMEKQLGLLQNQLKVIPQIESTCAVVDCKEILSVGKERFIAAAFGADDFTADFQIDRTDGDKELDFARKYFAICCHARKVTSIDTPYVKFKDIKGLQSELQYLKSIGFKAKFAIHPSQVEVINDAFKLSPEMEKYYTRLVQAFDQAQSNQGKAAIDFEGTMVDIAAYRRAKAILGIQ